MFPQFFDVPHVLLDRIVTKYQLKTYCRMQQTCHFMADFVKKNKRVKVWSPHFLSITANENGEPVYSQIIFSGENGVEKPVNFKSLYGVRFLSVNLDFFDGVKVGDGFLDSCSDILFECRIFSEIVTISECWSNNNEFGRFLDVLRPYQICIRKMVDNNNLWESVFRRKKFLKEVNIQLYDEEEPINFPIIKRAMWNCKRFRLSTFLNGRPDEHYSTLRIILKEFTRSIELGHKSDVRSVNFIGYHESRVITEITSDEIVQWIGDYKPIIVKTRTYDENQTLYMCEFSLTKYYDCEIKFYKEAIIFNMVFTNKNLKL